MWREITNGGEKILDEKMNDTLVYVLVILNFIRRVLYYMRIYYYIIFSANTGLRLHPKLVKRRLVDYEWIRTRNVLLYIYIYVFSKFVRSQLSRFYFNLFVIIVVLARIFVS